MTEATNGVYYRAPTLAERFWRKLGFHYHHGDAPEGPQLEGWMCTENYLHLGFAHRLRFLLTGRLLVKVVHEFDSPSPRTIRNRLDWMIYWPGQPR